MTTNIVLCYPVEAKHLKLFAENFPDAHIHRCGAGADWRRDFSSGYICGACQSTRRLAASGTAGTIEVDSKLGCGLGSLLGVQP